MTQIGTINRIFRFPVKSMAGEELDTVKVNYTGLLGDRVYGFVNPEKNDNFPWFTIRENPEMLLYKARFNEDLDPKIDYPGEQNFSVSVETPGGHKGELNDDTFVSQLKTDLKHPFEVRFSEKGMHDARPIALLGNSTVKGLSEEVGMDLDPIRFRANFYIDWDETTPFWEDSLVGKHIKIGKTVELYIQKKDPRCKIITVDPATAKADPDILTTVAKNHKGCMGIYGVVIREGLVNKGDPLVLTS